MKLFVRFAVAAAMSGALAGAAMAHEVTSAGVTVAHPWARATPGGVKNGVAFMEIRTAAGVEDKLVAAASPVAERVEIHTHINEDGVMKMRKVDSVAVKAGSKVTLRPGADHVMLMGLKAPLKEGDLFKMTVTFEKAGPMELEAIVEAVGAKGPHGMDASADEGHGGHGGHDHH